MVASCSGFEHLVKAHRKVWLNSQRSGQSFTSRIDQDGHWQSALDLSSLSAQAQHFPLTHLYHNSIFDIAFCNAKPYPKMAFFQHGQPAPNAVSTLHCADLPTGMLEIVPFLSKHDQLVAMQTPLQKVVLTIDDDIAYALHAPPYLITWGLYSSQQPALMDVYHDPCAS